jgi:hypothetical protein
MGVSIRGHSDPHLHSPCPRCGYATRYKQFGPMRCACPNRPARLYGLRRDTPTAGRVGGEGPSRLTRWPDLRKPIQPGNTGEVGTSWPKIAQVVRSCPTQIPSSQP